MKEILSYLCVFIIGACVGIGFMVWQILRFLDRVAKEDE